MNRRNYLKSLVATTAAGGLLLGSCKPETPEVTQVSEPKSTIDRTPDEAEREAKLMSEKFFTEHEMKTITVLTDIIIPKDEKSGSASDAKVPEFIEFIVKDMPVHQVPMRGGLRWLDVQCMKRYNSDFISCSEKDQIAIIDLIAFPESAKPEMQSGVAFFNLLRDLTATGFFTSEIGLKDLEYQGNKPNQWDGVPDEVLKQYGMKYDARTLEISVKQG
jgi:gluconate 2-dehydrogenase gamma chain